MKEFKSSGTVKKLAEISDVSKWPVVNASTATATFEPGTHYNLGLIPNAPFSYTLNGQASGAQWSFCFETGSVVPEITHPPGVKFPNGFSLKEDSHVEINILQIGTTKKWLLCSGWSMAEE